MPKDSIQTRFVTVDTAKHVCLKNTFSVHNAA